MNRKTLTDRAVNSLKPAPAGRRYTVADITVPGFGVRVTSTGHRTYVVGARISGSKHFVRRELGEVGAITLAEAREKARGWLDLIKTGRDPSSIERQKREENKQIEANSFAAVAEDYIARHLRNKRKGRVIEREIRTELIPAWGDRPITEITRRDVVKLVEAVADRGRTGAFAHNVFGYIRSIFNWAINRSIYGLEIAPTDRLKPRDLIGPKVMRDRVLDDDELAALWRCASKAPHPYGGIVKLIALTGCRLSEATGARWDEFDLDRDRLWTIPSARFKMGVQHKIPLSPDAIDMLRSMPRINKAEYVFSMSGSRPYNGISKSKRRLDHRILRTWRALGRVRGIDRRESTIPNFTLHDVRRSVRTRLSALRVPEPVAEMVIGHAKQGLRRVYNLHEYLDEMREALDAWANLLRTITQFEPPKNVVRIRRLGERSAADAL